jgi:hypothetical protein
MKAKTLVYLVLILALAGLVLALAGSVEAQADGILYVDADATGSNDGTSWADAFTDLQSALAAAVASDEIWVAEGTYTPTSGADRNVSFQLKSGVGVYGGFAGAEASRDERDPANNTTVLSGDIGIIKEKADNSYHVVTGSGTDASAVLDGFTVTGGNAVGVPPDDAGGGMFNNVNGSPTLIDITFSVNSAKRGGGMFNFVSKPTLINVNFIANSADDGGGMLNHSGSHLTLNNVIFYGNTADNNGGGMHSTTSSPKLVNVRFYGNSANSGGGMFNSISNPNLVNVNFSGNSADNTGGGMYNDMLSYPTLANLTFYGNSAEYGGGMYNCSRIDGIDHFTNFILWGNTATSSGAQIYNGCSFPEISYSLVQGSGGSGASWDSSLGIDGGGNLDADPRFVDADGPDDVVGTPDDNMRLQLTSPAIDAGDNSVLPSGVTTDIDGYPRFVDIPDVPDTGVGTAPIVDMGSAEAQAPAGKTIYLPVIVINGP